jgi:two-component system, chemotaxis family, CheB/CheR fusion protein
MAGREGTTGEGPRGDRGAARETDAGGPAERAPGGPSAPTIAELREVNEHLLIAGLREQELAAALETERAHLEAERAQLAVILAGIGDAVLVVDGAGTPVRTNAAYARLTGGADTPLVPEDAQGRPLPPAQTPQARAARGETFSLEFTLRAWDGSRGWYEAKGQPLQGSGRCAVVVIRDITLFAQHRRLQDEFLALAGHELRTPLTCVQGYLDLSHHILQRSGADEPLRRYTATALHHTRHLAALVSDLVDVTRLQSGKLTLNPAPLEVGALAAQAVETARGLPQEQTHPLTLDAPAEPLWVRGDAGRLEQVLLNLLTNALKYTPPTTRIAVRLRRVGGEVALAVHDDGPGIAADQVPHLFARFYQVERPDRASQSGLGLGLFICHELVAAHGGRLEVQSTEGVGTTFTVWLPLLDATGAPSQIIG